MVSQQPITEQIAKWGLKEKVGQLLSRRFPVNLRNQHTS